MPDGVVDGEKQLTGSLNDKLLLPEREPELAVLVIQVWAGQPYVPAAQLVAWKK